MATAESILEVLRSKGNEKTRVILSRHGIPIDQTFGVSNADLKVIAKSIKGQQDLAYDLFATGNVDAMYLAGIIANGSKFEKGQLEAWAKGAAGIPLIAEYTVPWVTLENPAGREVAIEWIHSGSEGLAQCGWTAYSGILATTADEHLDLDEISGLLDFVGETIHEAPNRARYTMNGFVIAVGTYVVPLLGKAKEIAEKIGVVAVNMGETACKVPNAVSFIEKAETSGQVGKKKKTIRC